MMNLSTAKHVGPQVSLSVLPAQVSLHIEILDQGKARPPWRGGQNSVICGDIVGKSWDIMCISRYIYTYLHLHISMNYIILYYCMLYYGGLYCIILYYYII